MGDEVDAILAQWATARPDLDVAPMAVWSRITRLAKLLDADRSRSYAAHDLDNWEFDVLAALRRAQQPFELSPTELARATHVTSGTMTNRIDRLAVRGLVERRENPGDRRGFLVRLTATGRHLVDAAVTDLVGCERSLGAALSAPEQADLARLLSTVLADLTGRAAD